MNCKYYVIALWLFLALIYLSITGCATFEPDDGRHLTPPTFHWHEYVPPKTAPEFDVVLSGSTLKNNY